MPPAAPPAQVVDPAAAAAAKIQQIRIMEVGVSLSPDSVHTFLPTIESMVQGITGSPNWKADTAVRAAVYQRMVSLVLIEGTNERATAMRDLVSQAAASAAHTSWSDLALLLGWLGNKSKRPPSYLQLVDLRQEPSEDLALYIVRFVRMLEASGVHTASLKEFPGEPEKSQNFRWAAAVLLAGLRDRTLALKLADSDPQPGTWTDLLVRLHTLQEKSDDEQLARSRSTLATTSAPSSASATASAAAATASREPRGGRRGKPSSKDSSSKSASAAKVPDQSATPSPWLSEQERADRIALGACLHCGILGHGIDACNKKKKGLPADSTSALSIARTRAASK
jgi:hypothetical protein